MELTITNKKPVLVLVMHEDGKYKIFAEGETVLDVNRQITKLYDEIRKNRLNEINK